MMHTRLTTATKFPVQGQRTASSIPAIRQVSRHNVPQRTLKASASKQGKADLHCQQAADAVPVFGSKHAMHGQSIQHASEAGWRGRRTAVQASPAGDSSGSEEQSVEGRHPLPDSASAMPPAAAAETAAEPEPRTSMNSGSSQQGARASKKVDAESRVSEWQQNSGIDVDHRPLWGTVMKGVGLAVLWFRELGKSIKAPFAVLKELTYPDPRGILRLTFIVLAASAVLTALVWSIDRTFAMLLFPPVARRLSQGASLRGS